MRLARLSVVLPSAALSLLFAAAPALAGQYQPGAEFRVYPSGEILSGFLGTDLGDNYYGAISASYDFAQRGSNGRNEHEDGGGFGGGVTVDKYFRPAQLGWFVGGRVEVFALSIDWRDPGISGSTDVTVLQPTARGGYAWAFDGNRYGLQLGLSVGAEINVHTSGRKVGDGAIGLAGAAFTFRP